MGIFNDHETYADDFTYKYVMSDPNKILVITCTYCMGEGKKYEGRRKGTLKCEKCAGHGVVKIRLEDIKET